jgi:hypothetical protein
MKHLGSRGCSLLEPEHPGSLPVGPCCRTRFQLEEDTLPAVLRDKFQKKFEKLKKMSDLLGISIACVSINTAKR